jgi:site-specific DNA-methyltransferase (adenine-specific)
MEKVMDVKNIPIKEIVPYAKNAKKHDKRQIDNVAESIRQYGFVQPVVIDRDGVIVIGHCRVLAAKKLGMESVPCVCVDDLTPEQVNALRLVDNKTNESDWDMDLLLMELPEIDLSAFDFDWGLPEITEEVIEDEAPEVDEDAEPITKLGDIWKLGRQTVQALIWFLQTLRTMLHLMEEVESLMLSKMTIWQMMTLKTLFLLFVM